MPRTKTKPRFDLRRWMRIIHLWLGIGLSIYLALVCVTGTILVYEAPIARWLNPKVFAVQESGQRAPLQKVMEAVERTYPNAPAKDRLRFRTFTDWNGLHRFFIESKGIYVYVDPFTAQVRGEESSRYSFMGQVNAIHTSLTLGMIGFFLNGFGGLLSCLLLVSGTWLWLGKRISSWRSLTGRMWVRRGLPFRRVLTDWHNVVGIYSLVLFFVICFTGSALIFGGVLSAVAQAVTKKPLVKTAPAITWQQNRPTLPVDTLVQKAIAAGKGANQVYYLALSTQKTEPAEVTLYFPEGLGVSEWVTVWLHPQTGQVEDVFHSPTESFLTRFMGPLAYGLHVGNWGGEIVKFIYAVLGLVPVWLSFTGIWMWLRKKNGVNKRRTSNAKPSTTNIE